MARSFTCCFLRSQVEDTSSSTLKMSTSRYMSLCLVILSSQSLVGDNTHWYQKPQDGTLSGDVQNWAMLIQNYILQVCVAVTCHHVKNIPSFIPLSMQCMHIPSILTVYFSCVSCLKVVEMIIIFVLLVWPTRLDPALRSLFVCVCVCVFVCVFSSEVMTPLFGVTSSNVELCT